MATTSQPVTDTQLNEIGVTREQYEGYDSHVQDWITSFCRLDKAGRERVAIAIMAEAHREKCAKH